MRHSAKLLIGVSILTLLLVGCGFQLRGSDTAFSLSERYTVQVNSPYPQLNHLFEKELSQQGFTVGDANTDYVIQVRDEESFDDEMEFGTNFDQPFKRLNYRLAYAISSMNGDTLVDPTTMDLKSDYYSPSGNYLKKETARISALEQLRKNAVFQVVNKLRMKLAALSVS